MSMMASQITSLTVVYSTVYLGVDQRKHQSRSPVNYPHKGSVMRKMVPFYDAIMEIPLYVRVVSLPFYAADNASGSFPMIRLGDGSDSCDPGWVSMAYYLGSVQLTDTYDRLWISNHIRWFMLEIITHSCRNLSDGFVKHPLKLWHGWIIISYKSKLLFLA